MGEDRRKIQKEKIQFKASRSYLLKLAEKYKTRGYEKIFLEKNYNYLSNINKVIQKIYTQDSLIDNLIGEVEDIEKNINNLETPNLKLKADIISSISWFFGDMILVFEEINSNEEETIENIDRFIKLEKEIDLKTGTLTSYAFNKEMTDIFKNLDNNKLKEINVIIFDQNNLKNINETYGHQIGQESIWKFGGILKEELQKNGYNYILSNYYGGDEWFLVIIDVDKEEAKNFIKKIFTIIKKQKFDIKNLQIKLGACAGLVYFRPCEQIRIKNITPKILIKFADTLLLQSKVKKSKNKFGNAFKFIDIADISEKEKFDIYKKIHTAPKKLQERTLNKKTITALMKIRKDQNLRITRARTLGTKKILGDNIELLNEVIRSKITEYIKITLKEIQSETKLVLDATINKISDDMISIIKNNKNLDKKQVPRLIKKILSSEKSKIHSNPKIDKIFNKNITIFGEMN